MSDELADGRKLRVLTIVDAFTRECVALDIAAHFTGDDVARILDSIRFSRGLPGTISVDNGPEFTSTALDRWAWSSDVKLDFSRPGKPGDNASIEAFNARVRQECLSQHYFSSLEDARRTVAAWREDYNNIRPHSALRGRAPAEFRVSLEQSRAADKPENSRG